jgi:hypothetical protein
VPVPTLCASAAGQHAYASQCTARQGRRPIRRRSRLVTVSATVRSNATAPSPIHRRPPRDDANGTIALISPTPPNGMATAPMMCRTRKAMASSERFWCSRMLP